MRPSSKARVRIDKWLWAARFFKTRSQSAAAVKSGRVDVNGVRAKPSHQVTVGSRIEVRKGPYRFDARVTDLAERRGNAERAAELYSETAESITEREQTYARIRADRAAAPRESGMGRPTKKQRRQLLEFRERAMAPEDWDDDDGNGQLPEADA